MSDKKLLNIGCGETVHPDWVNIDVVASIPGVLAYDVRRGLPYADCTFDACYCSHMLEHVTRDQATLIVGETYRVLKRGGVVRLVVPDFEQIVRHYLTSLEDVKSGHSKRESDYDWMMLELFDQTVRGSPGGEMKSYLTDPDLPNKEFITSRIGLEAERIWKGSLQPNGTRIWSRLRTRKPTWFVKQLRIELASIFVLLIAGVNARKSFREGLFRNTGEIHRWMYDQFSLTRLLTQAGFSNAKLCRADESSIPSFNTYDLDILDKIVRKPDSIYIEAIKP
jgi:SAM-dependent methyltransferase